MSLQFIIGNSGSGKSYTAYQNVIRQASCHPEKMYYVIVPEQFTMQTQKTLVEMHPQKGILNIDVLSFERLAYRVFEEVGGDTRKVLEETGKNMVLQKLVQDSRNKLSYLKNQMKKPGYLDEVKSLISEFMQYEVHEEELDKMITDAADKPLLQMKLKDVAVLYQAFREYLSEHFMTSEEVLEVLAKEIPFSEKLRGSTVVLDGYTGFTPVQHTVIRELLQVCERISVTVTMDTREELLAKGKPHELFYMSHKMIRSLAEFTKDMEDPIWIRPDERSRFADAPALNFLEQNLFRYHKKVYGQEQRDVQIFQAGTPEKEMEETARRIIRLVREQDCRYGQIAVITGNLEEYGSIARHVFAEAKIPFFVDEKHSVLMNPFVEYIRAALEMATQGFSYESVFRYLRCGMSDLSREETDRLENYVIALGIRGFRKWDETWVRIYRDMDPASIMELNQIREHFVEEIRELAEGFSGKKKTIEEYSRCLYAFIVKSRVQKKLKCQEMNFKQQGERAMEKEYAQIYGIVMELLDKIVSILGEEVVSAEEFRQLLETGMSQAKVALIPPGVDQVLIGDMERTRLKDIRALFFVGVNEGCIPKNTESGGILTEMDRDFLGGQGIELAPGPKELMNMQRFYLYLNLTKPSEKLCLSYSQANGKGEAVGPAFLIRTIQTLFPKISAERAEEPDNEMDLLETPNTSVSYFLENLTEEEKRKDNPVFEELYSWYLNSPEYRTMAERLTDAAFLRKPEDQISKSVAKALYGEISPNGATRLERFCACAFAHFLKYGLEITERAEYEFRAMDMGNIIHQALEDFATELRRKKLNWSELSDEERNEIADACLDKVAADYGNTILQSSARNHYMIERTRRILRRTVWALQEQLKNGKFEPEGFEVSIGGGRIDRLDVMKEEDKVYVKIIDYKTGNTSFDLVSIYYGLQMQLVVYMDAAMQAEQRKHPDCQVKPAGIFYYNVKDPMLQKEMEEDLDELDPELFKKLKMNGLVMADRDVIESLDRTTISLPLSYTTKGALRKGSSVAEERQFALLDTYVKKKIMDIRESVMSGNADVSPYEMGNRNACTYCPYQGTCGFDRKIPGYEFRRLKQFADEEIWKAFEKEVDDGWE
ncbi:helicase-exonuclease AddAB subunit AddB [Blautia sp. MSJ-19]|uniref:helicase-exonuclease AddAB subunit AddB n=1 Tax=Blautia sp. MSJ-19 TaxID=2841517 RepID=UPI001C0EDFFD|nr:helicase-exonuclease AddAB subunit AddB [Blautia sp. MSJ-19]MBU5481178.1 helicase-exonuclease AddAB subunit AddB [Blautia sp. MSJ-19]